MNPGRSPAFSGSHHGAGELQISARTRMQRLRNHRRCDPWNILQSVHNLASAFYNPNIAVDDSILDGREPE